LSQYKCNRQHRPRRRRHVGNRRGHSGRDCAEQTQPQLGSTVEPVVVAALPVEVAGRGRQIDQLQFTAPGTTGDAFSHRIGGGVDFEQEIVYNASRPSQRPKATRLTSIPYEMVQEFRVERSTFSAQFGLGQGALTYQMASAPTAITAIFLKLTAIASSIPSASSNNPAHGGKNSPPTDHENNYGFTVGGPISIPKVYNAATVLLAL